jgi:uncharacterized protein YbbK (DUF523 family)
MRVGERLMVAVSLCLAGGNCRYDGSNKANIYIVQLVRNGEAVPLCPEQLAGLPIPREAVERLTDGRAVSKDGEDFTEVFTQGAQEFWRLYNMYGCEMAILKTGSPSCGCGQVYSGNFSGTLREGDGITVEFLKKMGVAVISEEQYGKLLK